MLWIGQPGWNGIMALGGVLTGEINPSGRTVDFYMRDFTTDPTWYNFGNYTQANYALTGEFDRGQTPRFLQIHRWRRQLDFHRFERVQNDLRNRKVAQPFAVGGNDEPRRFRS